MAFNPLQKKKDAQFELREILTANPVIDFLLRVVEDEQYQWTIKSTGYYDQCRRELIFSNDLLAISACDNKGEHKIGQKYTDLGWEPMSDVTLPSGAYVTEKNVLITWAEVVSGAMAEKFPQLRFDSVESFTENGKYYSRVRYSVEKLTFKKWV